MVLVAVRFALATLLLAPLLRRVTRRELGAGIVLGAAYSLWLYRRVIFGALTKADLMNILDLSPREVAIFAPLVIVTLWIGIDPQPFFNVFHASVMQLIHQHQLALASSPRSIMLAAK